MALQEGNATVGFTAATGASEWQTTSVYDAEICTNEPAAAMGHYDASDAWRPEDPAATDVDTSVWKCYDMFSGAVSNNTVATLTGNLT